MLQRRYLCVQAGRAYHFMPHCFRGRWHLVRAKVRTHCCRVGVPWLAPVLVVMSLVNIGCKPGVPADSDTAARAEPTLFEFGGSTMGTHYRVVYSVAGVANKADLPEQLQPPVLQPALQRRLDSINQLMSTWDPASQLSTFNRSLMTNWVSLAPETIALIEIAAGISEQTRGAYDITMAPLLELYGFGAAAHGKPTPPVPRASAIEAALQQVGWRHLERSGDALQVRKRLPGLQIDLSSIAKGHAVDELGRLLEGFGVDHYLIDIGGELRSRAVPQQHRPWRIGLDVPGSASAAEKSGADTSAAAAGLSVYNAHVATSGDYRNYRQQDGRRVSHLIDARDGLPVSHGLTAVTVVHNTTALADAWATAFMVLGVEASLELAEREQVAVLLIEHSDQGGTTAGFTVYRSNAMKLLQAGS